MLDDIGKIVQRATFIEIIRIQNRFTIGFSTSALSVAVLFFHTSFTKVLGSAF